MAEYFVQSPHTKQECLQTLDQILEKGPDFLAKFEFGCSAGDHTGYGFIQADNETAARNMIPGVIRNRVTLRQVNRVTPDEVKEMHRS